MKKLAQYNLNSPEEYARIFSERQSKPVDWFDNMRWNVMLKYFHGGKLVDLGCLDSLIPFRAKERFPKSEVWGLDFVPEVIDFYSLNCPEINWIKGDVYSTHFPSNYFDYAVAGELIEHLEEPEKFFVEAFRILKTRGMLVLSTPLEETHAGEVDHERHLWSFNKEDIRNFYKPYADRVKIKVLGSRYWPRYKYHFPYIIAWGKKK